MLVILFVVLAFFCVSVPCDTARGHLLVAVPRHILLLHVSLSLSLSFGYRKNVPSQNTIRRFRIDRQEHTRFQVASYLWSMMNGECGDDDAVNSL